MSDVTTEDTETVHSVSPQTPPILELGNNATNLESDILPFIHDASNSITPEDSALHQHHVILPPPTSGGNSSERALSKSSHDNAPIIVDDVSTPTSISEESTPATISDSEGVIQASIPVPENDATDRTSSSEGVILVTNPITEDVIPATTPVTSSIRARGS